MIFTSEEHKRFFEEKFSQCRQQDVYHAALCYTLGINGDTRLHFDQIYDIESGCVKPECIYQGWQTSGSLKVVHLAINLYTNSIPTVDEEEYSIEAQVNEARQYAVDNLFCCSYAPYFWQAIKIRYPEYCE